MKQRTLDMTQGHPGKLLIAFALPLMAGNIFQQLYTVVDTAIVGQGVGMQALAALGTVDWMNWMYLSIAQGFTQGFSVRLSLKFGQNDLQGLKKSIGISIRLSVILAVAFTVIAQLLLNTFLGLLQVPDDLRPMATLYSRVILLGIPAMVYYNLTASILRSVGDSRTPLVAMISAALTNILLDCIAVFALHLGVWGAAAATVLAQCVAGTVCLAKIRRMPMLKLEREHLKQDTLIAGKLLALGLPLAAQNVIISVGGMAVQSVVNRYETSFIAGFTATNKLYGVLEIAAISYGFAITTYTGQNYGAMRWDRIRKGVRWAEWISLGTSAVIGALMVLLGRMITMLFISAEDAVQAAAAGDTAYRYLCVMSVSLPVLYLLYAYRSALQGMGNTLIPLLSGVVEFVVRVGTAFVISGAGNPERIFLAEPIAWSGAALLLGWAYYYERRKITKVRGRP